MIPGDELMLPSDVLWAVYSKILPNSDSNKLFLNAFFRAETFEYACQRNFWGEILLYCDGGADPGWLSRAELIGNYDIRLILLMSIGVTMLLDILTYVLVDGKSIFAEYVLNYVLNRSYVLNFGSCTDDRQGGRKSYPPSAAALTM